MKMLSYVSTSIYMESRSNPFLQYHGEANKSIVQIKSDCKSTCYVVLGFTLQIRLRVKWNVCHIFS